MGRKSDARDRLIATAHDMIWRYSYGAISIDKICEQAGVKKGSFYYFFDTKSDLTYVAISTWWENFSSLAGEIFRRDVPPLERILNYFDFVAQHQIVTFEQSGQILGCPLFTLGSEICKHETRLSALIEEILHTLARYFEEAIAQGQAAGEISGKDPALKSRLLCAFYEGTMTRARIENNPDLLRSLGSDAHKLLTGSIFNEKKNLQGKESSLGQSNVIPSSLKVPGKKKVAKKEGIFAELALMGKHTDEMVVLTDAKGRVKWVNTAFTRTCGYTLRELRGKKPGAILQGPESNREAVALLHQAVHSARPCECRMINYKKDGSTYPVHISLGPVFDEGKLGGFLAVEKDLTAETAPLVAAKNAD